MCLQRDAITVRLLNRDCVRQMASDWQDGLPRPGRAALRLAEKDG